MAEERDFHGKRYTMAEAVERAARTDPDFDVGTRPYRYWSPRDFGLTAEAKPIDRRA